MTSDDPGPPSLRQRVRHWLVGDKVDYGCAYCADDSNRGFGHVTQVASDVQRGLLLECPRCGALYEDPADGSNRVRRLSSDEATKLYPRWHPSRDIREH